MPPTGSAYFVDWIFSVTSNVHVINDFNWFTKTTHISVTVDKRTRDGYVEPDSTLKIVGIVEIPIETAAGPGMLTLKKVIFDPNSPCNILAYGAMEQNGWVNGALPMIWLTKEGGLGNGAFLNNRFLLRLKVVGQGVRGTSLDPTKSYNLHASLPDDSIEAMNKALGTEDMPLSTFSLYETKPTETQSDEWKC